MMTARREIPWQLRFAYWWRERSMYVAAFVALVIALPAGMTAVLLGCPLWLAVPVAGASPLIVGWAGDRLASWLWPA